jgi:hypothetical protein
MLKPVKKAKRFSIIMQERDRSGNLIADEGIPLTKTPGLE